MPSDHTADLQSICRLVVGQDRNGRTFLRGVRRFLSVREQLKILEAIDSRDLVFMCLPISDVEYSLVVTRHNLGAHSDKQPGPSPTASTSEQADTKGTSDV